MPYLRVWLDGSELGKFSFGVREGQTKSIDLTWGDAYQHGEEPTKTVWWLAEPEVSESHELRVTGNANCGGFKESVTVEALRLSVIGLK